MGSALAVYDPFEGTNGGSGGKGHSSAYENKRTKGRGSWMKALKHCVKSP